MGGFFFFFLGDFFCNLGSTNTWMCYLIWDLTIMGRVNEITHEFKIKILYYKNLPNIGNKQ